MSKRAKFLPILLAMSGAAVQAQILNFEFSGINAAIPDGIPTGLANTQTIQSAPNLMIEDINVTLSISGTGIGGFNGDLYATLQHEDGFAVLLNRPGKRSGSASGYSDSGLSVTFDDAAPRDIHNYRLELNGSHTAALGGALTGTWAPDARNVDPAAVLDSSPQTAFLEAFRGLEINGSWTLFVTDLSAGGTHQLDGWSMSITPVPEPASLALASGFMLAGFAVWRRFLARK